MMGTADNSFTIHGGSVVYKGHHYLFYHNGKLPGGGGYKRATCVEEFTPNTDGSIPLLKYSAKGVEPLQTLNPYVEQEAETINQSEGVKCEGDYTKCYVTNISNGDFIKVRNVDFGKEGAQSLTIKVRSKNRPTDGTPRQEGRRRCGTGGHYVYRRRMAGVLMQPKFSY